MNLSKLKLILIVLFLLVNLFFLFELKSLNDAKELFTEQEIVEAVEVLSSKGISIKPSTVIEKKIVPKTVKLDFDSSSVEMLVAKIMRGKYASFTIPDGHQFANDDENFSVFSDYTFIYQHSSHEPTYAEVEKALHNAPPLDDDLKKKAKKLLKNTFGTLKDDNPDISVAVEAYHEENGFCYLKLSELINSSSIDGAESCIVFRDGKPIYAYGKFFYSTSVKEYSTDYFDSINILFELESKESDIEKMELIYLPISNNDTSFYLVPTYKFSYSNGETMLYDATSGTKR